MLSLVWRAKQLQVCSPGRLLSSHPLDAMIERLPAVGMLGVFVVPRIISTLGF